MNIQQTTLQIIGSDNFRRLSARSGSKMLSDKVIEIRDEYRQVMNLLKK